MFKRPLVQKIIACVLFLSVFFTVGNVVFAQVTGPTGPTGADGIDGPTGPTGADGADGTNAQGGADGVMGTTADYQSQTSTSGSSFDIDCGVTNVAGCFLQLYYFLYTGIASVVGVIGRVFDAVLHLSISSEMYGSRADFVATGWQIIRDLANIFFIFILLYIAIGTILGLHSVNPKKMIAQVILIGLLINFSLFFSRVIIDAGNIFAWMFYTRISDSSQVQQVIDAAPELGPRIQRPISEAIIGGMNLEKIVSTQMYDKFIDDGSSDFSLGFSGWAAIGVGLIALPFLSVPAVIAAAAVGGAFFGSGSSANNGVLFTIITIGMILNIATGWLLLSSAVLFVGRIANLWFSMIFGPIAFVSSIVPGLDKKLKQLGWHEWISNLVSASFNAAIFMFFLYIIAKFEQSALISTLTVSEGTNVVQYMTAILIPPMIIIGLMKAAKSVAKDMAGQFGEAISSLVTTAVGIAGTAALGVGALGMSRVAAGVGSRLQQSKKLSDVATGKSQLFGDSIIGKIGGNKLAQKVAETTVVSAGKAKTASFDARNTGVANLFSKATGVNLNSALVTGIPGVGNALSTESTTGGYEARQTRKQDELKKRATLLGMNEELHAEESDKLVERKDLESDAADVQKEAVEKVQSAKTLHGLGSQEAIDAQADLDAINEYYKVVRLGGKIEVDAQTAGDRENLTTAARAGQSLTILQRVEKMNAGLVSGKVGGVRTDPDDPSTTQDIKTGGVSFMQRKFVAEHDRDPAKLARDDQGNVIEEYRWDEREKRWGVWNMQDNKWAEKKFSVSQNESAVENIKTARQKDYLMMHMKESELNMKGTKMDAFGNITAFGRVQHSLDRTKVRSWGRQIGKAVAGSLKGALVGGILAGPFGILAGGLLGAGNSGVKSLARAIEVNNPNHFYEKYFAGRSLEAHQVQHLDPSIKHEHGDHAHAVYKTPASDFISSILGGLGKSSGGGGGGGHDDHGGHH